MPPRLTLTNGPSRRGAVAVDRVGDQLLAGAALAGDQHRGVGAARPGRPGRSTCSSRGSSPITPLEVVARVQVLAASDGGSSSRRGRWRRLSAVWTDLQQLLLFQGLVTKSAAPAFMPATARSIDPQAVIRITGTGGCAPRIRAQQVQPLVAGGPPREVHVLQDQQGRRARRARSSASSGPDAACERYPPCFKSSASDAVHRVVVVDDEDRRDVGGGGGHGHS